MDLIAKNALALERELDWFERLLKARMDMYLSREPIEGEADAQDLLTPPTLEGDASIYADVIRYYQFNTVERMVIMLALAPYIRPHSLDHFFVPKESTGRHFTEFGGLKGINHGGFLPTGETAAWLIGGTSLDARIRIMEMFQKGQAFHRHRIAYLDPAPPEEPPLSGLLRIGQDYLELFTFGHATKPNFNSRFPARLLGTALEWEDLVLSAEVMDQVEVLRTWVASSREILKVWSPARKIKPGYRALFYGPPGTGKTLTASLVGKSAGKDVYLIDASMIVSKWVGETEKNLAGIFDMAENKDWILFFDEADALFGKRSNQGNGMERHGNQQTSYLLQRTENYPGTVILATNLKGNIDEAFMRRFQSIVYFPFPSIAQRSKLWEKTFAGGYPLEAQVDFAKLAKDFEISGGSIVNVLKYCAIMAEKRGQKMVMWSDIVEGARREMVKEGRRV